MLQIPTSLTYYPSIADLVSVSAMISEVCARLREQLGNPRREIVKMAYASQSDDETLEGPTVIVSLPPALLTSSSLRFVHWRLEWEDGTSDQYEITFAKQGFPWVTFQYDAINATLRKSGEQEFENAGRAMIEAGAPAVLMATEGCYGDASIIQNHLARMHSNDKQFRAVSSVTLEMNRPSQLVYIPASQLKSWFNRKKGAINSGGSIR